MEPMSVDGGGGCGGLDTQIEQLMQCRPLAEQEVRASERDPSAAAAAAALAFPRSGLAVRPAGDGSAGGASIWGIWWRFDLFLGFFLFGDVGLGGSDLPCDPVVRERLARSFCCAG